MREWLQKRKSASVLLALGLMFSLVIICAIIGILISESGKFQAALLGLPLTIAVFSVNFSFLGYQFSPYRATLRKISESHVLRSGILLVTALLPLAVYFLHNETATAIAIAVIIPITIFGGILLLYGSVQEVDPIKIIQRVTNKNSVELFYLRYGKDIYQLQKEIESWALSKPTDKPMHEWDNRFDPPSPEGDPLELANNLITIAVQSFDMARFIIVLDEALLIAKVAYDFKGDSLGKNGYKVTSRIHLHASNGIKRIASICLELDKSGVFCNRLNQVLLIEIQKLAIMSEQTNDYSSMLAGVAFYLSKETVLKKRGDGEAMALLCAFRQVAQKGIDSPPSIDSEKGERALFENALCMYPIFIKEIGVSCVEIDDSNLLYRCLEALCWLGCSAVRNENYQIVRSCLQGLSYLGRLAKNRKLTCFWTRCALDPNDHAYSHIWSMMTWLERASDECRESLFRSFEEAYSRLAGTIHKIEIPKEGKRKGKITVNRTDAPYITRYSEMKVGLYHEKEVDYSDFSIVKDYHLY